MTKHRTLLSAAMALGTLTLALAGCGGEPAPVKKNMVIQGGGGGGEKALDDAGQEVEAAHVENSGDFASFAFPCCSTPGGTKLVGAYVDLSEKLAADDEAAVGPAVDALATTARAAASEEGLSEAGRAQAADIATKAEAVKGKTMEVVRLDLAELSVAVITFARDQKGGEEMLSSAFCPMAPGHWLQRGAEIRNPYYGAEMLTCGTLEDVAEVTAGGAQ